METDIAKLIVILNEAQAEYEQAEAEERSARIRATDRRNKLNCAQADVDTAIWELKKNAPRSSDWKSNFEGKKYEVSE